MNVDFVHVGSSEFLGWMSDISSTEWIECQRRTAKLHLKLWRALWPKGLKLIMPNKVYMYTCLGECLNCYPCMKPKACGTLQLYNNHANLKVIACTCKFKFCPFFLFKSVISEESSRVLKARQRTQARFESFLQDAVAEERCEKHFLLYKCFVCLLFLCG